MNSSATQKTAVVIGCGKFRDGKEGWAIGHSHASGYRAADPEIRLCGVDIDPDNLAAFGAAFGIPAGDLFSSTDALYRALIPDFASVCTWPGLHAPQVIEAAERGVKGIYCEKPLALSPGEILEMQSACTKSGAQLAVAHQRRMEPVFRRFREIVVSGELGDGLVVEGRVGDGWDILSWTTHLFDMANFIFDAAPVSILAGMDHSGTRRYRQAVEDNSVVFVQYPDNRQAVFITGPDAPGGILLQARGTRGMMTLCDCTLRIFTESGLREETLPQNEPAMAAPIRALMAAVETGAPHACQAADCALATELAYAAHESARALRQLAIPTGFHYAPLEVVQAAPKAWLPAGDIVIHADGHFGSGGREGIAEAIIAATGRRPVVVDAATTPLDEAILKNASLLLIYHTQSEPDESTSKNLRQWVAAGKPLAIVHAGLGAYPKWPEYLSWCGRVWSWGDTAAPSEHPHESSQLLASRELALAWREATIPKDEVFIKLVETSPCDDLVEAEISGGRFPAAWTNPAHPRLGVFVPGHRRDLWSVPALRECFIAVLQKICGT
jgi:predicted dehydrogenase